MTRLLCHILSIDADKSVAWTLMVMNSSLSHPAQIEMQGAMIVTDLAKSSVRSHLVSPNDFTLQIQAVEAEL